MGLILMDLRLGSSECINEAKRRVSKLRDAPTITDDQLIELNRLQKFLQYQECSDQIKGMPLRGDVRAEITLSIHRTFANWISQEMDKD